MFDGKFYTYQKNGMEFFIKAENYQVWRVIEIRDFEVTTTNSNNKIIPKPITEYETEDFQKMEMNALAFKLFHCGLEPNKHNCIMGYKSAQQIWDLLEVTHDGTRFTNITNERVSLGRHIPVDEQVRKILRSLPQDERQRGKVTTIQDSKDFTKFNLEELAGSLMTHELHLGIIDSS